MIKVLLVDDERQISALTQEYLQAKGMSVVLKHSGEEGYNTFKKEVFDICVLDVKMPMKDGFTLAAEIREWNEFVPIIFLTGQSEKEHRIKGLVMGADDYITKPFSMEELALRIQAVLRRVNTQSRNKTTNSRHSIGLYNFDAVTRELFFGEETLKLTAMEAQLLEMFCESENGVVSRDLALKRIWGDEDYLKGRSLNVYVSKLRQFLSKDPAIDILNVHGTGYRLVYRLL